MSFRVFANGTIECDRASEALELQAAILRNSAAKSEASEDGVAPGLGIRFLSLLLSNPIGLSADEATSALGVTSTSLPPMLRGLRNWASKNAINPDQLIIKQDDRYTIGPNVRNEVEAAMNR